MKGFLKDGHPLLVTGGYQLTSSPSRGERHCGSVVLLLLGQSDKPKKGELSLFLLLSQIFIPPSQSIPFSWMNDSSSSLAIAYRPYTSTHRGPPSSVRAGHRLYSQNGQNQ